jgi:hypothetical protein
MEAVKPGPLSPGLACEFYQSRWTRLPEFATLTSVRTGVASALDLKCAQGEKNNFGLRFAGY